MDEEMKRCPLCGEKILAIAVKCRYCGSMLSDASSPGGSLTGIDLVKQALGNRYEIIGEIGRGGMATVYKAVQKNLNRPVALKVVHQNLLHDIEFVARFHREAQLCASLNHPNIVTVYDEGQVSGVHFMAMEYLEGTDLGNLVRSRGRLGAEQTMQYLLAVSEALDYSHGRGLIHRDIKSANIFITGSGRVVLTDFGIAHAAAGTQLTRAGTVIGTPEYMSPEQADGRKVDHRTDLYSLGVVMYECLAGKVPLSGENAVSTIYKVIHERAAVAGLKDVASSLQQLTFSLLEKDPADRLRDAGEVSEALRLIQRGETWYPKSKDKAAESDTGKRASADTKTKQSSVRDSAFGTGQKEDSTIKVGKQVDSDNISTSYGSKERKRKVPAIVWVLSLIGVGLIGVLVYHYQNCQGEEQAAIDDSRRQQQIIADSVREAAAERERLRLDRERQELDDQKREMEQQRRLEEERQQQEAEQQRQLAEEQERLEAERAEAERERQLAEEQERLEAERAEAERERRLAEQRDRERLEAERLEEQRRDQQAWQTAQSAGTITAYERYLRDFPSGRYTSQAKESISKLQSGTFTDPRDGQEYRWVRIGEQVWMAENLNYATSSGSWCYDNQTANCNRYGRLYNWETARNACPTGWYLPSDAEWTQLTDFVGGNPGTRLKARSGWDDNGNGTDDYGFSALPGGRRRRYGGFSLVGSHGRWWSSTEYSSASAWRRAMYGDRGHVYRYGSNKGLGFSVRCVRDN